MTETEELKKNTEQAYMLQRIEAVRQYIHKISEESIVLMKATFKADAIEGTFFLVYFISLIALYWFDVPADTRRVILDYAFLAAVFAMLHAWKVRAQWREKEGEWIGATTALAKLGILPERPEDGDRIKRKRKIWSEGIAMVKRWAEEKAAELKKGFAPA